MLFESSSQFSLYIEEQVKGTDRTYMETIVAFCDANAVDPEDVATLISSTLKQKIYEEAVRQYSMPKMTANQLDVD